MSIAPVIILCPPRSYSSVVSAMIGQHPQVYAFPELNLFVASTVGGLLEFITRHAQERLSVGLLRSLAQLQWGEQTTENIKSARGWLDERRGWSVRRLFNYLLKLVHPRIGIEKSPLTPMFPEFLDRAYRSFPRARFLHLTRHPITSIQSLEKLTDGMLLNLNQESEAADRARLCAHFWYMTHLRIVDFTRSLAPDQTMRIRGEDVIDRPETVLPHVATWLGIRADREAIENMNHPELSPYARLGPENALLGNDPNFLASPKRRLVTCPHTLDFPTQWRLDGRLSNTILALATAFGYAENPKNSVTVTN